MGMKGRIAGLAAGAAMGVAVAGSASAADLGIAVTPVPEPAVVAPMFDVAFGVTGTSEYVSRGFSLSDGWAVQPWAELRVGIFYMGYWGSNVVSGDWEHDLSIGIRPTFGPFGLDLGYVRYLYADGGDCCGELYAKASYAVIEPLSVGATVYYDPDAENTYIEGNAKLLLPENFSISGAVGNQYYGDGSSDVFSWNAGASWAPVQWVSLDARYYGGPTADKFVFSVAFTSSLSALGALQPAGGS